MEDAHAPAAWRFDRFTLDALLGPDGAAIPLRPKSLALLKLMVAQAGRVVGRDAIMTAVWPDVVVGDESITQCVRDVRKALSDEAQTLMRTVPKRGYLLAAEAQPAKPAQLPSPARAERRLAAILAADIVGYSRLVEEDEAATLAAIRELRASPIDPLLAEHKGRIVKLMGDGAIVEFASVVDAVACAVAIQKAVADRQVKTAPDRRIVFRIGTNLGDVVVDGDDLLGDGVNVAARLEQLCEPGGVLVSGTAFDHLQGRLGLPLEFTGEQQVKNIARPVRAYRVKLDGAPAGRGAAWTPTRRSQRALLTAAAALFAAVFLGGVWHFWPAEPPPGKPSIAVLPFDNLGGDEATGRLADGITEDIITDLARFRDLDVIARNSTEVYKGKSVDVREVANDLSVGYVLEGSIQRDADRLRVTAQLIDAASGVHVWSQRWDRSASDVFVVQAELADMVAANLGGSSGAIAGAGQHVAKRKAPEDLDAYDLYLLGVEAMHRLTPEDVEAAIRLLKDSLKLDPGLARAWTALAWCYDSRAASVEDQTEDRRLSLEAAERAAALDPADGDAHAALANMLGAGGDLERAEAEYERALALNPKSADSLLLYAAWASGFGKAEKGVEAFELAARLNPTMPPFAMRVCRYAYFMVGRYAVSLRCIDRLPRDAMNRIDLAFRAAALAGLGRTAEAQVATALALAQFPDLSMEGFAVADPSWSAIERARLLDTMRAAGFPLCMTSERAAQLGKFTPLPECQAERAKAALAAKAG